MQLPGSCSSDDGAATLEYIINGTVATSAACSGPGTPVVVRVRPAYPQYKVKFGLQCTYDAVDAYTL
jgi:hypothetical protein